MTLDELKQDLAEAEERHASLLASYKASSQAEGRSLNAQEREALQTAEAKVWDLRNQMAVPEKPAQPPPASPQRAEKPRLRR